MEGSRRALVAVAAGLALADASIVALALPPILTEMHTTIAGVAAVIGVYALVLALALWPASRVRFGPWGFIVFALGSLLCSVSGSLWLLLVFRAVQAVGGAAVLTTAFALLDAGESRSGRRLWLGAALVGTAAGPAIGGALTEAFDWRAIFIVQAPLALLGALASLRDSAERAPAVASSPEPSPEELSRGGLWSRGDDAAPPAAGRDSASVVALDWHDEAPAPAAARITAAPDVSPVWLAALAFTAAAFTAVLFLLVIELVAGLAMSPLRAALGVTVLPLAALAGAAIGGEARPKALAGAVLIAGGAAALAFLPAATIAWTIVPQVLAGGGMGLALPAFSTERTVDEATRNLVARHAGIVIVLAILAPVATAKLNATTDRAVLQGASLVLDSQIDPVLKLRLAPELLVDVDVDSPRQGLKTAIERRRGEFAADAAVYDRLAGRLDDVVVVAVQDAFGTAYLIAAALAVLAAALLATAYRKPAVWLATAAAAATVLVYAVEHNAQSPAPVVLKDPCQERDLPDANGFAGTIQNEALRLLDQAACQTGTSREEFALALFDPKRAKQFERDHGINPRSANGLLSLLGG